MEWENYNCPKQNNKCSSCSSKIKKFCYHFFNLTFLFATIGIIYLYYKESNNQLNKVKILEESVKDIMCELSDLKSLRKIVAEDPKYFNHKINCPTCSEQHYRESFEKFTVGLHKEIADTKRSVDQFIETFKNGNNRSKTDLQVGAIVNYAQESLGAKIVYTKDTPIYPFQRIVNYFFDWLRFSNPPRELLRQTLEPGSCYGFKGHYSVVVIKLAKFVIIDKISIDHILDTMSPSGDIKSAPKNFNVYGLIAFENGKSKREVFLGNFNYDIYCRQHLQYFDVNKCNFPDSFKFIKFEFLSNYGNENFTCVYRVGVHGKYLY